MALYKFKVSDSSGKVSELLVEGDSQADATRRVQRRGLSPLEFLGEGSTASGRSGFGFGRRFDVVDFTDRLVPLLEANIPLERALGIVGDGMEDSFSSQLVADLRRGLHEGRKFSDLIRDRGRLFPGVYSSVVEAGEEAGALPQVLGELRRFLMESRELRAFVLSASIYPLFIVFAGSIMLGIVLGVIVPRFARVLADAGTQSSAATRLLLTLSTAAHSYWWVAPLLVIALLAVAWQLLDETSSLRVAYDRWILRVPLGGRMVLFSNLARMARTMSILMRSGVHLLDTVSIANRVIQNRTLRESIAGLSGELRQGEKLSHALGKSHYIPPMLLRMLAVGEETGSVETMLERIAERYEGDLRRMIKRLLALFEPIIIIVLGLFVGSIVLLMFLAIMDMQSNF